VVLGIKAVPYDDGKQTEHGLDRNAVVRVPPREVLDLISFLEERLWDVSLSDSIDEICAKATAGRAVFTRPAQDRLYKDGFNHQSGCDCLRPEPQQRLELRSRANREGDRVHLFKGCIGSSDTVMKNAHHRDSIAREKEILCYEMEAVAVMGVAPCLAIRGISDYSDGHKNDDWHPYAALAAAVCARETLLSVSPQTIALFPLTVAGNFLDRYITGAVSNPNAFSGNEIERLRQNRDSLMERHAILEKALRDELQKMKDESRGDFQEVRTRVQELQGLQEELKTHLEDLDRFITHHDNLLLNPDPVVRDDFRRLKSQVQRDTEAMENLSKIAQDGFRTTSKLFVKVGEGIKNGGLGIAGLVLGAIGEFIGHAMNLWKSKRLFSPTIWRRLFRKLRLIFRPTPRSDPFDSGSILLV
jgi:hypothetical protein